MSLTNEQLKDLYLDHHNCDLSDEWSQGCDFEMQRIITADDYEIYSATHPGERLVVEDHVYQYSHSLIDKLKEKIKECDKVFCDEDLYLELDPDWQEWCEDEGLIEYDDDNEKYVIAGDKEEE